jgi:hypothetical protein
MKELQSEEAQAEMFALTQSWSNRNLSLTTWRACGTHGNWLNTIRSSVTTIRQSRGVCLFFEGGAVEKARRHSPTSQSLLTGATLATQRHLSRLHSHPWHFLYSPTPRTRVSNSLVSHILSEENVGLVGDHYVQPRRNPQHSPCLPKVID